MKNKIALFLIFFILFRYDVLPAQNRQSHIETNAGKVYYDIEGKGGSNVLFLSGGPGAPPQSMRPVIDYVKEKHRCILLHQRGTGTSNACKTDSASITLENYLNDILSVMNKERIEQIYLVGHSWGAILALHFMTKYPGRVKGAILIGASGLSLDFLEDMNRTIMQRIEKGEADSIAFYSKQISDNPTNDHITQELSNKIINIILSKQFYDTTLMSELLAYGELNAKVNYLMMAHLNRINWNLEKELKEIKIPTLIINGDTDPIGLAPVKKLQEAIPESKLHIIKNCGHYVWLEQPEELKQLIMKFL